MILFDFLGFGILGSRIDLISNSHQYMLNQINQQDYMHSLNQYLSQQQNNNQDNKSSKDYIDVEFEVIEKKLIGEVK